MPRTVKGSSALSLLHELSRRGGMAVAETAVEQFVARATRLYEQEPGEAFASSRLGLYVHRWLAWLVRGLVSRA